jgi:hypothetical protein
MCNITDIVDQEVVNVIELMDDPGDEGPVGARYEEPIDLNPGGVGGGDSETDYESVDLNQIIYQPDLVGMKQKMDSCDHCPRY